ncbi:Methyltransferase domain-containing protein [Gracilibacillus ureilyticus]|uniref:Methyltransferase domain-containing protein n=1 Tax=Gracilibacillus ureilyticus TaxID=531814 RepID=A0A1H9RJ82_9BACI|nr:class I SAM-dependent methyltransferase [Gracilibacillus ureilyticus]SER72792.1 Methyltransferase domain-containing protein [Gracilibacillus ureilyticus]
MAYSKLAYVYDILMDDAPYDQWQKFVTEKMTQYQPEARRMLDLGCGTGEMSIRFAKSGMEVTGVDYSEDMLAYAQAETTRQKQKVTYLQQDIRSLEGLHDFDVIISLCDVINYVTEEGELQEVFQHAADALASGGIFIFDVHSLKHFRENMAGQTFAEIYEDVSYVWFCENGEREGELYHDLTFFILHDERNLYERFDETHHQRTFPVEFYKKMIGNAGMDLLEICGDFSINPGSEPEQADRIFFVCQK